MLSGALNVLNFEADHDVLALASQMESTIYESFCRAKGVTAVQVVRTANARLAWARQPHHRQPYHPQDASTLRPVKLWCQLCDVCVWVVISSGGSRQLAPTFNERERSVRKNC